MKNLYKKLEKQTKIKLSLLYLLALFARTALPCFLFETWLEGVEPSIKNFIDGTSAGTARYRMLCCIVAAVAFAYKLVTKRSGLEAVTIQLQTFRVLAFASYESKWYIFKKSLFSNG